MQKYEVKGIAFHKKTDSRSTFSEFTVAVSEKKAYANVVFRLKSHHLREVSITVVTPAPVCCPTQLNLGFE